MSEERKDQTGADEAWEEAMAEQQAGETERAPESGQAAGQEEATSDSASDGVDDEPAGGEAAADAGSEVDQQAMADEWAQAMEEQTGDDEAGQSGPEESSAGQRAATEARETQRQENWQAERAELDELEPDAGAGRNLGDEEANLDVIMDIPVTLSMEIGRTQISIRHLLQLNQGSVVELDRLAGEPLDVMVNGTLIAHGEVVVVNERFGIRLTDVISAAERVKKLR
ncbi:flagellar motor switch protein FliN [Alkalilimnicola ehrlichii]|uniref:flagellar motor switch protein FliN n=1 Tax=Alkalilimnicola ehrlichii TaxID=351052 RepID=UPI003BA35097